MKLYNSLIKFRPLLLSPILLLVIVCFLYYLPNLIHPSFGLIDDGFILATNKNNFLTTFKNFNLPFEVIAGRFRPVYWLIAYGLYLFNPNVLSFYFFRFAILIGCVLLIYGIVLLQSGSKKVATCTALISIILSVTASNFYRLWTQEAQQIFFILVAIYTMLKIGLTKNNYNTRKTVVSWIIIALSLAMGYLDKETSIILFPIALIWLSLVYVFKAESKIKKNARYFLIINLILFGVQRLLAPKSGGYITMFNTHNISSTLPHYIIILNFTLSLLPVLTIFFLVRIIIRRAKITMTDHYQILLFLLGSAFGVVYLPWVSYDFRYVLPSIYLFTIFSAYEFYLLQKHYIFYKLILWTLLLITVIFSVSASYTQAQRLYWTRVTESAMINKLNTLIGDSQDKRVFIVSNDLERITEVGIWTNYLNEKKSVQVFSLDPYFHLPSDSDVEPYTKIKKIESNTSILQQTVKGGDILLVELPNPSSAKDQVLQSLYWPKKITVISNDYLAYSPFYGLEHNTIGWSINEAK